MLESGEGQALLDKFEGVELGWEQYERIMSTFIRKVASYFWDFADLGLSVQGLVAQELFEEKPIPPPTPEATRLRFKDPVEFERTVASLKGPYDPNGTLIMLTRIVEDGSENDVALLRPATTSLKSLMKKGEGFGLLL